jgi:hypothetical protein
MGGTPNIDFGVPPEDATVMLSPMCPVTSLPARSPLAYGKGQLDAALLAAGATKTFCILTADNAAAAGALTGASATLDPRPESYAIVTTGGSTTFIVGRDESGAMYGALELAERVKLDGASVMPPAMPITGAPAMPIRGIQVYMTTPQTGESPWWFVDKNYWEPYLDLLARTRTNFLDLRGMYDVNTTGFPNALPFFAHSPSFPDISDPRINRDANIAALEQIVALAKMRGIKTGFMTFSAGSNQLMNDADLQTYMREAMTDIASRVPDLWRMGFRIGESGKEDTWYKDTAIKGVTDASQTIGIYTRSWGTTKTKVLSIFEAAGNDPMVTIKYNGEKMGPPWVAVGGAAASYRKDYWYEDYLQPPTSTAAGKPYTVTFEFRQGGTYRIFRNTSLWRARLAASTFTMGLSKGVAIEPTHAYMPQQDFWHADEDKFSPWAYRRDELTYYLYGRLSYDGATPERIFRTLIKERTGTDALWEPMQAAGDIVPWIDTAHQFGPDQRDFAPELEMGGEVGFWAQPGDPDFLRNCLHCGKQRAARPHNNPMDTFVVASPTEAAADYIAHRATTKISPLDVARYVLDAAAKARAAGQVPIDMANAEAHDIQRECIAEADLGDYFGHKLRAATVLAVYLQSGVQDYLDLARSETTAATDAWTKLAADAEYIKPFVEAMRMKREIMIAPFHWKAELGWIPDEAKSIDKVQAAVTTTPPPAPNPALAPAATWVANVRPAGPGFTSLTVDPPDPAAASWKVTVVLANAPMAGSVVNLLWKPLEQKPGSDFVPVAMTGSGTTYEATVPGTGSGGIFAVEVVSGTTGWRYPDPMVAVPYLVVAKRAVP